MKKMWSMTKQIKNSIRLFSMEYQKFSEIPDLSAETLKTLERNNFINLYPIQKASFMKLLEGENLLARDKTGSGKTLAFCLPLLENLRRRGMFAKDSQKSASILILAPTRELAIQITEVLNNLQNHPGEFRVLNFYGGTSVQQNLVDLKSPCNIIVGTPGRIQDLIERKAIDFKDIEKIVLDETDRMLDMGFLKAIENIFAQIENAIGQNNKFLHDIQFALFSATLPKWVKKVTQKMVNKKFVHVDLIANSEETIPNNIVHYHCFNEPDLGEQVFNVIKNLTNSSSQVLVFVNSKLEARELWRHKKLKHYSALFHGDISQLRREISLNAFRQGYFKILICTDVAGRGIDVPEIDLVINICLPNDVEDFIHRCGRTARGDKSGTIVTFLEESEHKKYDFIIKKCNKTSQLFEQNDQKYLMENFKQSVVGLVKNLENVQLENKIVSNEIKNILIEKFGEQELFEKLLMEHLNKNLGKKLNQISQFFEQQALLQENEDKEEIMEKVEEKADDFHFPKYYENPNNIYVDIPSEYLPKCLIIRINSQIAQSDLEEFMIINKIKYSSFEIQRDRVVILFANKYDSQYAFFKISRFNYKGVTGEVSYKKNRGLQRNLQKNLDNF